MALEHCKECEKKVSEHASVCPHCGISAPTTRYSKETPKCNVDGCNEISSWPEKYRGRCRRHYQSNLDIDSFWWFLAFIVFVFLIF
jgi:thymidine kinase